MPESAQRLPGAFAPPIERAQTVAVLGRAAKSRHHDLALRCLLPDEAAFVDAAFQCILPEARAEGLEISASTYVDSKLAAGAGSSRLALQSYRSGIADVQALCERTLTARFQALPIWQQLAVLAQIEASADAARGLGRHLLDRLLNDAAEAYFEVAVSRWAEVGEARYCAST